MEKATHEYPSTIPDLLTLRDVAKRLRCSLSNAYGLVERGELRAYRVGAKKGYRVSEEQLQAFLAAAETAGDSLPPLSEITYRGRSPS